MIGNITNNGVIESISSPFGFVLNFLYVFLGGIFGIYVIVFIVKVIMNLRIRSYMKEIKEELNQIKKSITKLESKIVIINENNKNDLNNKKVVKIIKKRKKSNL